MRVATHLPAEWQHPVPALPQAAVYAPGPRAAAPHRVAVPLPAVAPAHRTPALPTTRPEAPHRVAAPLPAVAPAHRTVAEVPQVRPAHTIREALPPPLVARPHTVDPLSAAPPVAPHMLARTPHAAPRAPEQLFHNLPQPPALKAGTERLS